VVYFHGNGETVADGEVSVAPGLGALGLNVVLATYRGYGASTGSPSLAALVDDAPAVIEALGEDPARLIVFGRSVGSIPALAVVRRFPTVAALILESAIADPLERVLMRVSAAELGVSHDHLRRAFAERLDHAATLAGFERPLLLLHARHDTLVGVDNAKRLAAWAGGAKVLKIFDHGDHNTLLWQNESRYFAEIAAFVAQLD
jgi:pimeloyl-ACP methyl ester carboxylesterase